MTEETLAYTMHTVQENETLWDIAENVYGESEFWQLIYQANKQLLGCTPDVLLIGTELVIPNLPESDVASPPGPIRFHTVRPGKISH